MGQRISWPVALVVTSLIAAVTVLGALGRPVSELLSLGMLVLGALLYGKVETVQQQTNGANHRLVSIVERIAAPPTVDGPTTTVLSGQTDPESLTGQGESRTVT